MNYHQAITQAITNKSARGYPDASDPRSRNGTIFPIHKPRFKIEFTPDKTVFTIGSCFARTIEEALFDRNVFFPTRTFFAPKTEWPFRPNGLLNEFNPGTVSQRILFALDAKEFSERTIVPSGAGYADLLLILSYDVSHERALARRNEIRDVYSHLAKSDVVIITLGLIESWYDEETGLFMNRAPPHAFAERHEGRFTLKQLDVYDCMRLLRPALDALSGRGIKIILTVSPVPLETTFTNSDCVVANELSKAVLRVCAQSLANRPEIDYFPSYEIVRCSGLAGYQSDQVHVRHELVHEVTRYMASVYEQD
jgi:GSCFA family